MYTYIDHIIIRYSEYNSFTFYEVGFPTLPKYLKYILTKISMVLECILQFALKLLSITINVYFKS